MTDRGKVNVIFIIPGISHLSKNHLPLTLAALLLEGGNSSCLVQEWFTDSGRQWVAERSALTFVCAQKQQFGVSGLFRVSWWSRKHTAKALCGSEGDVNAHIGDNWETWKGVIKGMVCPVWTITNHNMTWSSTGWLISVGQRVMTPPFQRWLLRAVVKAEGFQCLVSWWQCKHLLIDASSEGCL